MTIGAERPPVRDAPQEVLAVEGPFVDEAGLAGDAVAVGPAHLGPVAAGNPALSLAGQGRRQCCDDGQ